ncbi:LPS translocon maturation chaperone LptM [Aliikangiella sp. IMCC44359]|uniref:LPS translocon maturation chaperone LptM n=1 Tax=Aliikangiella sp. IMCC44359 TaxID=3459125 RepID=UPI00403B0F0C
MRFKQLIAISSVFLLVACGQKGPLVLNNSGAKVESKQPVAEQKPNHKKPSAKEVKEHQ